MPRCAFNFDAHAAEFHRLGRVPVVFAGHALATDCVLVTNNMRDFARVKGLCADWVSDGR